MQPLKIIVIGPIRSGKTTISNFLADATEIPYDYHPTKGVRILEFEVQNIIINNKHITKDIELWDCSGDHKFENCWPAIRKDIHGVIFVYNEKSSDCLKEIQQLYDYFIASTFMKISHIKCNIESGGSKLKTDFASFISTILNKMHNYTNQEDKNVLNENILFAK
ncbi:hypothetical protein E2986_04237 [Frieseomelitta varia]|uniref:Intraflagellar transport protein 22 homolog n=1 Tax=Frieseomelitta varia TaxID=561572 RepID=A0A833SD87_9HYME|nr:hypothetical protein E2986_04237 [Frieseomelitta varia]